MSEGELDELMGEVGGPCNVMGMVNMFQENGCRWRRPRRAHPSGLHGLRPGRQ